MNQQAYQEITKMLNAFPQSTADIRGLLLTYEEALSGLDDAAICETARKFVRGEVAGHNRTFAPSIAEFCDAVRKTPVPGRQALPPRREFYREPSREEKARMGFKMSMLLAATGSQAKVDMLANANRQGIDALVELASQWGVPVPAGLRGM